MTYLWILGGLLLFNGYVGADMDLYINQTEASRLLGIDAELFYVRNGIINNYALSFNMPIPPDIQVIYFNWQSLRKQPQIYYNMGVTVSNPAAMHPPQFSIQGEGSVPSKPAVFSVSLICTGEMSTEVDIRIQLNVSIFSVSNLTTLDIKRRKTCLQPQDEDYGSGPKYQIPGPTVNGSYVFPIPAGGFGSTNIFYVAVGSACGVILLIALIVFIIYMRGPKPMQTNQRLSDTSSATLTPCPGGGGGGGGQYMRADTPNNSSIVTGLYSSSRSRTGGSTPVPVYEPTPHEVRNVLRQYHVERSDIVLADVIMEGTFGKVYHGTLVGEDENDITTHRQVFVKAVTENTSINQIETFLRECCFLHGLSHPHLLSVMACTSEDKLPLVCFPFSNEGNMKKFLQRCKLSELGSQQSISTQQLVYMALQIIRAVQFMHRKRLVHRDLATRNCVVDNQLTVKVTDPALSRDIFPHDYHCLGDNENRPVKWLSLEALLDRHFTPPADVWSFGVVLWELVTLGQQPYAEIDPFEMSTYLQEGYRISQPLNCPDELFAVMSCCWAVKPEERPKMSQLLVCMQDFYTALGRYI